jgi:hypothetical protein
MYLCAAGVLVLCAAWFLPSKRNEAGDLIGVQES